MARKREETEDVKPVRYAYGISSALLIGGAAISLVTGHPAGAQIAQNDASQIRAVVPHSGAPTSFADLTEQLLPAVVNISTRQQVQVQQDSFFQFFRGPSSPVTQERGSLGSGFLISADGYVVTNNHVIALDGVNAAGEITVTLSDDREFPARVIGRDPDSDIAVLKIDTSEALPFVTFGDSTKVRAGDWVIAIGNPFGLGGTVTAGIVSSAHRNTGSGAYDEFIQTDASINSGNSGGPMFDMAGNVIGINNRILSPSDGSVGIGFAIPSATAQPIVEKLISGEEIVRGYLGVRFSPIPADLSDALGINRENGEMITAIVRDQPADKAGLMTGDIVLAIDGKRVTRKLTASSIMSDTRPDKKVEIELLREGKPMSLSVTVGKRPGVEELQKQTIKTDTVGPNAPSMDKYDSVSVDALGLEVATITPEVARELRGRPDLTGVVVLKVEPGTNAAAQQLDRGLIIRSVNYVDVTSAQQFKAEVEKLRSQGRSAVVMFVMTPRGNGGQITVRFKVPAPN